MKSKFFMVLILNLSIISLGFTEPTNRIWIYFKDKGPVLSKNVDETAKHHLSERSITRRAHKSNPVKYDFTDLPIYQDYIFELNKIGIKTIHKSKWLNAVSTLISDRQIEQLNKESYIKKIVPVKSFKFYTQMKIEKQNFLMQTDFDYGDSYTQNHMHGIIDFHNNNFNGSGILIALFDTGFKTSHMAFDSVNVLHTWDFVENDSDVTGYPGETHGANTLGVIAGYSPGNLIGPAFAADYILAKTDDYYLETHRDEDNWVAAAEWADSLGADIISSSVGYNIFDPGEFDYTYEDMDGNTAITTIAADLAVKKGIAVFSTAGNEGTTSWRYILAPADGDSVIAIGNVTSSGIISPSSSRGPSYDDRIKPDLVALGTGVQTVSAFNDNSFVSMSGTSFSTPLAAGAGALVLEYNNSLLPRELYNILIQYASQYRNPDNNMGYGIINIAPILNKKNQQQTSPIKISSNPFSDYVNIYLDYPSARDIKIYNALGQKIKTFDKNNRNFIWFGDTDNSRIAASGIYFISMVYRNKMYTKKIVLTR
jgi:subtilisin family serine protease